MATVTVYNMQKKKVGEIDLPEAVFGAKVDAGLLHQAVRVHLTNARGGNASTKTRANVRGGGRKPYKQKGTGQARHGSIRSPIFVGGGAAWGPHTRDFEIILPKKQKKVAVRMALSMKQKEGQLFVVDKWASTDGKTAKMAKALKGWEVKSGLVVTHEADEKTVRAIRNIPNVKISADRNVNVYDLIRHEHLFVTKDAVSSLAERLA